MSTEKKKRTRRKKKKYLRVDKAEFIGEVERLRAYRSRFGKAVARRLGISEERVYSLTNKLGLSKSKPNIDKKARSAYSWYKRQKIKKNLQPPTISEYLSRIYKKRVSSVEDVNQSR